MTYVLAYEIMSITLPDRIIDKYNIYISECLCKTREWQLRENYINMCTLIEPVQKCFQIISAITHVK